MIDAEGLENVWTRHRRLGEFTRAGAASMGLDLFADPAYASNTVTAMSTSMKGSGSSSADKR